MVEEGIVGTGRKCESDELEGLKALYLQTSSEIFIVL